MSSLLTYLHTVRYLKPVQVYGRVWFRVARPSPDLRAAPTLRARGGAWAIPPARRRSVFAPRRFVFLNEEHDLTGRGWDDPGLSKLWRYHLHYFDDLNAANADQRNELHRELLLQWVHENPPGQGTGWEPFPTSLRIVNWIKWHLRGQHLSAECLDSLAVQVRWLARRLERHILGNHLFANAKALVFAGLFFEGDEADRWLRQGIEMINRETGLQVLPDGGHFERSPMYHALFLEDVLDLLNLLRAYGFESALAARLAEVSESMRRWLAALTHPDGDIAFFNDAAMGQAPRCAELASYGQRLDLPTPQAEEPGLMVFRESGYIRCASGDAVALLDVAPIGPDWLPAHAHADTLSFELSLFGQRAIVNSGTSRYGSDEERLRQRGTAAHSTVIVDGRDSSEVWGGFRVARRARPFDLRIVEEDPNRAVTCSHDGYLRLPAKVVHTRTWSFGPGSLAIEDRLSEGYRQAEARFHLHPDATVRAASASAVAVQLGGGQVVEISCAGGRISDVASTWHPEFGVVRANRCLVVQFREPTLRTTVSWTSAV